MSRHTGARTGPEAELRAQRRSSTSSAPAEDCQQLSTHTHRQVYRPLALCLALLGAASYGCADEGEEAEAEDTIRLSWQQQALGADGGLDDASLSDAAFLDAGPLDGSVTPPPGPD